MSHIFRLHKEKGTSTIVDWDGGKSNQYGSDVIAEIKDPNGETSKHEITSIPSPFARIDLVKTAFAKVVDIYKETGELEGNSAHHKMVSDAFDIGQLFFEFDKHKKDKLEIIVWDKKNDLDALLKSKNPAHKQLGETYRVFLDRDGDTYNFNKMERLYMLNYTGKGRKAEINIIGATSPATLFVTRAYEESDLKFVTNNISFGNHNPFDGKFTPLHKRDLEYIKFWFALRKSQGPDFSTLFPEMESYLNKTYESLDNDKKDAIDDLKATDFDVLKDIPVGENAGHAVEVLNFRDEKTGKDIIIKLKQNTVDTDDIEKESGFVIDSDKYKINGHKPLVLPVKDYTASTIYTKAAKWNKDTEVYSGASPIEDRILPNDGSPYPYLTISDFLTDTIVRMPYEINKESFFDGNIDRAGGNSYLLPLTDLFFKFFTAEQLCGTLKDGNTKMFEFQNNAGGITAVLRIPIKNGKYMEYRRTYFENKEPKIEKNEGGLVNHDFVFALFPNIRFNLDKEASFRFGIIPDEHVANNYKVKYVANTQVDTVDYVRNENYIDTILQCKNFILENSNFNYLEITCPDGVLGIVVPKLKSAGKEQFTFAIDFGTTNTHIEYCRGRQKPVAFDIGGDLQINLMPSSYIGEMKGNIYCFDFIPEQINNNSEFKFPTRTALSAARKHQFRSGTLPFVQGNVAFWYEKKQNFKYNEPVTGLKWTQGDEQQDEKENENKVQCFIESLCMMLRNKVVLNNGDLSSTKIIWSYPVSMEGKRLELFEQKWKDAYEKYFGDNMQNLVSVTESIAPYIYYKDDNSAASDMVSIDVGGGTTDMVVVVKEQVKFITSFRFAANAIFGNGYAKNSINGIIKRFQSEIEQVIEELPIVQHVYDEISAENDSANIASFLFSLKDNWDVKKADKVYNTKLAELLDFQTKLSANTSHKIIFALFYAAIIYHLANLMKSQKLNMPRHIAFSGNGSKIIQILSKKNTVLEDFTKLIFEKVYVDENYEGRKLTIIQSNTPKEVTCKGAILYNIEDENFKKLKKVILKGTGKTKEEKATSAKEASEAEEKAVFSKEKYVDINQEEYINGTVTEVEKFLRMFLDLLDENPDFMKNFGISYDSLEVVERECFNEDLKTFAWKGLKQKLQEVNPKQPIEETFFFYPLVGLLNTLSKEITNSLSNDK